VTNKQFAKFKVVVANALMSSPFQIETEQEYKLEMIFYPTEEFMADYRYVPVVHIHTYRHAHTHTNRIHNRIQTYAPPPLHSL
jgi:hypothetical protein